MGTCSVGVHEMRLMPGIVGEDLLLLAGELLAPGLLLGVPLVLLARRLGLGELALEDALVLLGAGEIVVDVAVEHDEIEQPDEDHEEEADTELGDRRQAVERRAPLGGGVAL